MAFVITFMVILAILWFILPFAIFGTKSRLDEQTQVLRDLKKSIETQTDVLQRIAGSASEKD